MADSSGQQQLAFLNRKLHVGPILSPIGGRTDHIPLTVPSNSYVLPADVVSGVPGAEGNTLSGHRILDKMFHVAPYGASSSDPYGSGSHRANGGAASKGHEPVEIVAAGGEYVVSPDAVARIGGGDVKRGHAILDAFVKGVREKNIKTLKKLPGPVKK